MKRMASSTGLVLCALLALTAIVDAKKAKPTGTEKLLELRNSVRDGVVTLDSDKYDRFVLRPDRPYHFFLLFTAMDAKYSCEVCKQIHPEFLTLAESYESAKQVRVDTRDGHDIFFGIVDFDMNGKIFGVYDFTSAPHIMYVGPERTEDTGKKSPTRLEAPPHDMYNVYTSGKDAEGINHFLKQKTGFEFSIQRSKLFLYGVIASVLVILATAVKLVISHFDKVLNKLRRKRLWMTVSFLFYGLSVSGMVYCIIREPQPYSVERNGQIKFFHPGGRSQFVVEGLIIGGYDILAAACVILLSEWAIYLNKSYLRIPAVLSCAVGFVAMYKLMVSCYQFKNRWYQGWMGL